MDRVEKILVLTELPFCFTTIHIIVMRVTEGFNLKNSTKGEMCLSVYGIDYNLTLT